MSTPSLPSPRANNQATLLNSERIGKMYRDAALVAGVPLNLSDCAWKKKALGVTVSRSSLLVSLDLPP